MRSTLNTFIVIDIIAGSSSMIEKASTFSGISERSNSATQIGTSVRIIWPMAMAGRPALRAAIPTA